MQLLSELLTQDPSSPRFTIYDETADFRLDFSATTLDNWAAKVANFLREEVDLESGATISIDLVPSWQAVAITLGALASGITVSFNPSEGDALFTHVDHTSTGDDIRSYADSVGARGDIILVTNDPMGRGVEELGQPLPVGTIDFGPTVRFYGDQFFEDGPAISELATATLPQGERLVNTGWTTWEEFVSAVINPLAAGGSTVTVTGNPTPERLEHIAATEKVTARL